MADEFVALPSPVPTAVSSSGVYTLTVTYKARGTREVWVELFNQPWQWRDSFKNSKVTGSGSLTLSINGIPPGCYDIKASLRPVGGQWDTSVSDSTQTGLRLSVQDTPQPTAEYVNLPNPVPTALSPSGGYTITVTFKALIT